MTKWICRSKNVLVVVERGGLAPEDALPYQGHLPSLMLCTAVPWGRLFTVAHTRALCSRQEAPPFWISARVRVKLSAGVTTGSRGAGGMVRYLMQSSLVGASRS